MHPEGESLYLLLDRYLAGEASESDAATVREWLAADPEHVVLLEDLRLIRRIAAERVPESDVDAAWSNAVKALKLRASRWPLIAALAAAAVIVVIGGAALLRRTPNSLISGAPLPRRAPDWKEYATASAQRAVVRLRDGTQVTLAPQSRLRYTADYGGGSTRRDVYLEGEAYFQVQPDAHRPFRVHTARSVTEDLGTAFVITAYPDQTTTEVMVAEGRVALWRAGAGAGAGAADTTAVSLSGSRRPDAVPALVLAARDLGRLESSGVATVRRGVDVDRRLVWTRGVLAFDAKPLGEAVLTLKRWYDVEIRLEVGDSALAARRITATFNNEPIDLVLKRIALTLGLRVDRAGSVFLLRNGS